MNTQDKLNQLLQFSGQHLTVTGVDANQCTAVVHEWLKLLGLPIVWGNAVDIYQNAPDDVYIKSLNTPTNFPVPGDIIVWHQDPRAGTNAYGHVAVVLSADINTVTVFEQNDPSGAVCRTHTFINYAGVTGWLHPRVLDVPEPVQAPTPQPEPPKGGTVTVTARPFLNLRTGPGTNYPIATGYDAQGNKINRLMPGVSVKYVDVVQGESINGNPYWLVSVRGNFFSAAGTDFRYPNGSLKERIHLGVAAFAAVGQRIHNDTIGRLNK